MSLKKTKTINQKLRTAKLYREACHSLTMRTSIHRNTKTPRGYTVKILTPYSRFVNRSYLLWALQQPPPSIAVATKTRIQN